MHICNTDKLNTGWGAVHDIHPEIFWQRYSEGWNWKSDLLTKKKIVKRENTSAHKCWPDLLFPCASLYCTHVGTHTKTLTKANMSFYAEAALYKHFSKNRAGFQPFFMSDRITTLANMKNSILIFPGFL